MVVLLVCNRLNPAIMKTRSAGIFTRKTFRYDRQMRTHEVFISTRPCSCRRYVFNVVCEHGEKLTEQDAHVGHNAHLRRRLTTLEDFASHGILLLKPLFFVAWHEDLLTLLVVLPTAGWMKTGWYPSGGKELFSPREQNKVTSNRLAGGGRHVAATR